MPTCDPSIRLAMITLVVSDYDEAIDYYTNCLGFRLIENREMDNGKRWVVVEPSANPHGLGARLLLAKAASDRQRRAIGNQTGGRVGFFLETDDFDATYADMVEAGVTFLEAPRHEAYGTVAVFEDPYGNRWDLIERRD